MEENFGFDLSNQDAEKINSVMDAIQIFHSYYVKRLQPAESGAEAKKWVSNLSSLFIVNHFYKTQINFSF